MPKITQNMIDALEKAVDCYGNVSQLAKKMGIAHSTVLFWMSGKTRNISGRLWIEKIRPVLLPFMDRASVRDLLPPRNLQAYLAAEPMADYHREGASPSAGEAAGAGTSPVQPEYKGNSANVISFAQLADYDPALDLIGQYVKDNSSGKAIFAHEVKNGYFALQVDDTVSYGKLPLGTYLLVAGMELAQNSDTVVAKIRETAQIVVCTYTREGSRITLTPFDSGKQSISWDFKEKPGFLFWMYPVIEANLNFRRDSGPDCGENPSNAEEKE